MNADITLVNAKIEKSYDEIPYISRTKQNTHPVFMAGKTLLLGYPLPEIIKPRILEIGCGQGTNLHSIASLMPQAECMGIDISAIHINQAKERANKAGLKNIQFEQADIFTLESPEIPYDFIIAHGVFSWVPHEVRIAILKYIRKSLHPKGLAFVSHNTQPGFYYREIIREYTLFHLNDEEGNYLEKAGKVRDGLDLLRKSVEELKPQQAYTSALQYEYQMISELDDNYIMHEYTELENKAFYFSEFCDILGEFGLHCATDAGIDRFRILNPPAEFNQLLNEYAKGEEREQILDYALGRQFREAIIVHQENIPEIKTFSQILHECRILSSISKKDNQYFAPEGVLLHSIHPIGELVMEYISVNKSNIYKYSDIISAVQQRIIQKPELSDRDDIDLDEIISNQIKQIYCESTSALKIVAADLSKPAMLDSTKAPYVLPFARVLTQYQDMIPNIWHEPIQLTQTECMLLQLLDGSNTVDDLCLKVAELIKNGSLSIINNSQTDNQYNPQLLRGIVQELLTKLQENNILMDI
jgi:2-polyprenyl-3-methyl-5-hydroxy-6-metoxy-1,4-benzoquinol methylase/methyltransferase-like protein